MLSLKSGEEKVDWQNYLNLADIILFMGYCEGVDRETAAYHFRRRLETWRGVAISATDTKDAERILDGLNSILEDAPDSDNSPARIEGQVVFCTGNYGSDLLGSIRSYARDNADKTVILEGSYFDFLGGRWVKSAKNKYRL